MSVCSSSLSEVKSQASNKQETSAAAVIQSFQFDPEEDVLFTLPVDISITESSKETSKTNSPFRKLICVTKDADGKESKEVLINKKSSTPASSSTNSSSSESRNMKIKEIQSNSSPSSVFQQKTLANLEKIKSKYSPTLGSRTTFMIVTSRNVYMLRMNQSPVDLFLCYVMQGQMRDADVLVKSFGLEKTVLMELAGDIR